MEEIIKEAVSDEELKKFEKIYFEQLNEAVGTVSIKAQFEYAWCLVRSKYASDITRGIILLENLYNQDVHGRRDYLFYLCIGNIRIKEYSKALKFCRAFLEIEPTNRQVQQMEAHIKNKINTEGKIALAITTAGVLIVGAFVTLGMSLAKTKN